MAKEDLLRYDGVVSDATGGGLFRVVLDNGTAIKAKLGGQMKRFKIKVLVGDRVTVGLSPYDLTHGLIFHRFKT